MNAKLVERLARWELGSSAGSDGIGRAFCQINLNPAFGWHIARSSARDGARFPTTVTGRDNWLFRAYMMCLDPAAYHDHDVETAYVLSQQPAVAATLKAMLIAGLGEPVPDHIARVAKETGIPSRTVEAFEILFFNVLDRSEDGLYLSEIVYPQGRLVEFDEDYFATTPVADLILRAAYNHRDLDFVGRLVGKGEPAYMAELAARRDLEAELEKRFMANALLLASCNLLNQRSVGVQRGLTLLAAGRSRRNKAGAQTAESPDVHDLAAELALALAPVGPPKERRPQGGTANSRKSSGPG